VGRGRPGGGGAARRGGRLPPAVEPVEPGRLLLLGADAATWEVLDGLIAAGRTPDWGELARRGVRGELATFKPTSSPLIWTSIATGKTPAEHGIVDFVRRLPGSDERRPYSSGQRTAAAVWDIFARHGRSAVQVKWWASWPAEPLKG